MNNTTMGGISSSLSAGATAPLINPNDADGSVSTFSSALLDGFLLPLTSVGCGILAGLYFIFSVCVMPSLDSLPSAATAIEVMNQINVVILNPIFFSVFMGTPVLAVFVFALKCCRSADGKSCAFCTGGRTAGCSESLVLFLATVLIVLGEFGLTAGINVPLNDELALFNPKEHSEAECQRAWSAYNAPWTRWNSIRGLNSAISAFLFAYSIRITGAARSVPTSGG
ncbi:unnamed protein product [Amoebophrya sp. A25]|nr:unnamed protein product [Amoebophrya sp. A25]|eukprot:GSA25T00013505001.1